MQATLYTDDGVYFTFPLFLSEILHPYFRINQRR